MKQFSKAIAAVSAALVVAGSLIADGNLNASDWIAIAAAFVGALGVYAVSNEV